MKTDTKPSDTTPAFERMKQPYEKVRLFWLTLLVDQDRAINELLPDAIEYFAGEDSAFGGQPDRDPASIFCEFVAATESLTDGSPCCDVRQLEYNPIELFGEAAIAGLFDVRSR